MLRYINQFIENFFARPSPEEQQRKQLLAARGALLDAQLDLEWAEARVACLKASVERLSLAMGNEKPAHRKDWLTLATFD